MENSQLKKWSQLLEEIKTKINLVAAADTRELR